VAWKRDGTAKMRKAKNSPHESTGNRVSGAVGGEGEKKKRPRTFQGGGKGEQSQTVGGKPWFNGLKNGKNKFILGGGVIRER